MPRPGPRGLAAVAGALLGAAFLPLPLGWLAWVALVPLVLAIEDVLREPHPRPGLFAIGYLFGFVFYLIGTHWIARLSDVAITVPWLKYPAWIAAAAYLGLYGGLAAWGTGWLVRRGRLPFGLAFPCAFLAVEELRASGELGFPWFQPGYTQHAYAPLVQLASLGGVTLVTLWVLTVNLLAARSLRGAGRARALLGAVLALALPWSWGSRVLAAAAPERGPVVGLVQANIAGDIKWSGTHQNEILATFIGLSERAVASGARPTIVIWPETATGSYLRQQPGQAVQVAAFAARTGVPVFTGFADYDFDSTARPRYFNAAGLFAPAGPPAPIYAKRHLVPFGERMPFQRWIPALGRIELGQAEWTPGTRPVLFPSAAGPFSCLVCFEAIFPDLARADVRHGARWLVNITNDEWFGNGAALGQHAAMAVFRAAENHVPLARCANTGITLVSDAYGRVVARVPVFRPEILVTALPRPAAPTPFTRWGDWPGALAGIGVAAGALRALTGRARPA